MTVELNAMRWDGSPGHYEVWYLSTTDPATGCGLWIRYTLLAPLAGEATASLWLMAMDPRDPAGRVGRKLTVPASELVATQEPFSLRIGDAVLDDRGMRGAFEDVAWDLSWEPSLPGIEHVHPVLRRARLAQTELTLPHPDLAVRGRVRLGERELTLTGAHGGQAHLWGAKHARRWAWTHAGDFQTLGGEPRPGTVIDAASVFVTRYGRTIGPSTPVVGRVLGEDFRANDPVAVMRNESRFGLTHWRLVARDGRRRIELDVTAPRETLVGVTYQDPDGEPAYCYNSEAATMQLAVWDRARNHRGWALTETLVAPGRAHVEYAQREPLDGLELHVR